MAFINNLKDKLSQAGQSTAQKAKDISDLAKLNSTISNAERQISDLYSKVGYEIYCAYRNAPQPEVAELIQQINDLHKSIEDCKAQIKVIQAIEDCPQCGAQLNKGFCNTCGYRAPVKEKPVAAQAAFCSNCGAPISADSAFCTSCGQKIG